MDKEVIFGISGLGALAAVIWLVSRSNKKKQEKKDKAYQGFRTELENKTEPEKINAAVFSKAFNVSYWKEMNKKKPGSVIAESVAVAIAKKIADAWNAGTFWDDLEEEVYSAFRDHRLKTFADVSRVAAAYEGKKGIGLNLWRHLNSKLSSSELAEVKSIVVSKIPT